MIPFDVDYLVPDSIDEAVAAFTEATAAGRSVRYLGGGTELVTMARTGKLTYDTLIDLKHIPELTDLSPEEGRFGAGVRLSDLADGIPLGVPPLLAQAARGVADRTIRNAITLGGNVCGVLPYRESVLPLLVFDAGIAVAGPDGTRTASIGELFDRRLRLEPGEFVAWVETPAWAAGATTWYSRKTQDARVDYPLVSLCMAVSPDKSPDSSPAIRFAVSGVFGFPVRCAAAENALSSSLAESLRSGRDSGEAARTATSVAIDAIQEAIGTSPRSDSRASGDYRRALFGQALGDGVAAVVEASLGLREEKR